MAKIIPLVTALFTLLLAPVPVQGQVQGNVKNLGYATYSGVEQENGISYWLGMRYAAAPLGNLPSDPPVQEGTVNATEFGPLCVATGVYPISSTHGEDCLMVDVFAPTNGSNLPVYFFIQGGAFNANSNPNYNGSGLVEASGNNIVVVSINYRVGPYGFLAAPEVVENGASLNNGLKDIIQGLRWVNQHISAFGGDPNHVTIGGDSAGAFVVSLLLTAYGADGTLDNLFHAAAAESSSFGNERNIFDNAYAYNELVNKTGCAAEFDPIDCLRGLDVNTLQKANKGYHDPDTPINPANSYLPTIDGDLVPDYTQNLIQQGKFMKIPVIFGDDTNEGTMFVHKSTNTVQDADNFLRSNIQSINDSQIAQINFIYMSHPDDPVYPDAGQYWQGASNAFGEIKYICAGITYSSAYNSDPSTAQSNWNYHYAVIDPPASQSGMGTIHTIEINAIWGPGYLSTTSPASYSTINAPIVRLMQGYWTSFIRDFNPNTYRAPGSPQWDPWGSNYSRLFIRTNDTHMETVPEDQSERCSQVLPVWYNPQP